ncbi:MAG: hypothetical protein M3O15_06205, partial [Acidobacteriota bacterium]|nr:hypothetical protein [Acidobacteriota bacterium]
MKIRSRLLPLLAALLCLLPTGAGGAQPGPATVENVANVENVAYVANTAKVAQADPSGSSTELASPSPAASPRASLSTTQADPVLWPEPQRAFFQDGPALLLPPDQRDLLLTLDTAGRDHFIREFLAHDPIPETPENELTVGIERRQRLAVQEFASPRDVRAQLLFLNGRPADRLVIDCGTAFKPMEIWTWRAGGSAGGTTAGGPATAGHAANAA